MKTATVQFEVKDNFTVGDCWNCNQYVMYTQYGDDEHDFRCSFGCEPQDCPIVLVEGEE